MQSEKKNTQKICLKNIDKQIGDNLNKIDLIIM